MKGIYFILIPVIVGIVIGLYIINNSVSNSINDESSFTKTQLLNNGSPKIGDNNAEISIVEFGDYQCTFCKKFFDETENSIVMNYVETGKVKVLFKDFIVVNEDSVNAASAAHCANVKKCFGNTIQHYTIIGMVKEQAGHLLNNFINLHLR